jgi:hypothetical protein
MLRARIGLARHRDFKLFTGQHMDEEWGQALRDAGNHRSSEHNQSSAFAADFRRTSLIVAMRPPAAPPRTRSSETFMALQSQLFSGDPKLEAAAVSDSAHIVPGSSGDHVRKIQMALIQLDGAKAISNSNHPSLTSCRPRPHGQDSHSVAI